MQHAICNTQQATRTIVRVRVKSHGHITTAAAGVFLRAICVCVAGRAARRRAAVRTAAPAVRVGTVRTAAKGQAMVSLTAHLHLVHPLRKPQPRHNLMVYSEPDANTVVLACS